MERMRSKCDHRGIRDLYYASFPGDRGDKSCYARALTAAITQYIGDNPKQGISRNTGMEPPATATMAVDVVVRAIILNEA